MLGIPRLPLLCSWLVGWIEVSLLALPSSLQVSAASLLFTLVQPTSPEARRTFRKPSGWIDLISVTLDMVSLAPVGLSVA